MTTFIASIDVCNSDFNSVKDLKYLIDILSLEITYYVLEENPQTSTSPHQPFEIEIDQIDILISYSENVDIDLTEKQKEEIVELLDNEQIETLCWENEDRVKEHYEGC